ncbi:TPA: hypothetical protein N2C38_006441, partial [Pseudomonas aeruginosa]|nr:hypothetical protein [Pseudomonas aeruginosa]
MLTYWTSCQIRQQAERANQPGWTPSATKSVSFSILMMVRWVVVAVMCMDPMCKVDMQMIRGTWACQKVLAAQLSGRSDRGGLDGLSALQLVLNPGGEHAGEVATLRCSGSFELSTCCPFTTKPG